MRDMMHAEDVRTAKLELRTAMLEHQEWKVRMAARREREAECVAAWWAAMELAVDWGRHARWFERRLAEDLAEDVV